MQTQKVPAMIPDGREELLERERVLLALSHQDTDRVPTDFWAVPEVWSMLSAYYGGLDKAQVLENLHIDVRLAQPDYIGPPPEVLPDGSYFLPNGTHRRLIQNAYCSYEEYAGFPLEQCENPAELIAYPRWPKVEWYDWDGLSAKIGEQHRRYYVKIELGGPFECAWGLRGLEQYMMDMVLDPEIPHTLMTIISDFYVAYITKALEVAGDKIDMVYTWDDIASQNSLLLSPEMWEEFIKPYHQKINRAIKAFGKTIMYHSCGAVAPMIDRLAQLPIDVLNPLQPQAAGMDFNEIKAIYGNRLCFHGAIDIQGVLPHGTPSQVKEEVARAKRILGKNGGYILAASHHLQADTPVDNILAMYGAERT